MNGIMLRVICIVLVVTGGKLRGAEEASTAVVTPLEVAMSFGYTGILQVEDITEMNRRENGQVIWSGRFTASDNTFAPTIVTIAGGKSILTPSLSQQLEAFAARSLELPNGTTAAPPARRLALKGGAKGFALLMGVGPGGTGYSAVVTSPNGIVDIAVSIRLPANSPLQRAEQSAAYDEALSKGQDGALQLLLASMPQLYAATASKMEGALENETSPITASKDSPRSSSSPKIEAVLPSNSVTAKNVERRIAEYVESGATDSWSRLRRDLLDLGVPRDDAIRIAKGYLTHAEPHIRYAASDTLYKIGDRSGVQALVDLASSPSKILREGISSDLRVLAAMTLAQYRDAAGADAVASLYLATKDRDIREYAAALGARQIIPDLLADMAVQVTASRMEECAQLGVLEAKTAIQREFNRPGASNNLRVAAAAALVKLGELEPYSGYVLDLAGQYATDSFGTGNERDRAAGEYALRSIGVMRSEAARGVLEAALDSVNPSVSEIGLVQLCVNYPDSGKARERLLNSFQGKTRLPATTVFRLAAMSKDAEIREAAARSNGMLWQMSAMHEKGWDKGPWLRGFGLP